MGVLSLTTARPEFLFPAVRDKGKAAYNCHCYREAVRRGTVGEILKSCRPSTHLAPAPPRDSRLIAGDATEMKGEGILSGVLGALVGRHRERRAAKRQPRLYTGEDLSRRVLSRLVYISIRPL